VSSVRRPICKKQSVTQIVQVACPKILPSPGLIASVSTLARIFFCCKLARASLATLAFKPGGGESRRVVECERRSPAHNNA